MEISCTFETEFNDILLSAVRQGDVNLLESHLSTISNPDLYLNRVYDETGEQKCTPLMIACINDHENIISMLLDRFKPDLEVLNDVLLDEEAATTQDMFLGVSVLWVAASINNFQLVKLFVKYGANVNHTSKTNSTPLRGACYNGNVDMARFLIENGADIHIAKEKNETNLMLCIWHNHLNMATYLLDEVNCDVNQCDDTGYSSLYYAVYRASFESVKFLLEHGARNFRANINQMSPLMWAAEKRLVNFVDAISPYCSLLEQIEAKELLGSAFVCAHPNNRDLEQAFQCFYQALELRLTHNLLKSLRSTTIEIFDNRQECQTLEQLEDIRSSLDNMYIEALLIRERLLKSTNAEYRYSLFYRGALLADNGQYHRTIDYWLYELTLRQKYSISPDSKILRYFGSLFSEMLLKSMPIPIDVLLKIMTVIIEELEHNKKRFDYNLYTILFLIKIVDQFSTQSVISSVDQLTFYRVISRINRRRYMTSDQGLSLLHLSLDNHTLIDDHYIKSICQYPCLQTARVLLQCGADVNAIDIKGNTPLHIFVSNKESTCDGSILKLLCNAGAHLDYVNALGKTPFDSTTNSTVKQLLKIKMHLSLKCLCARLIQKNNILFHGKISTSLVNFLEKH